MTERFSLAECEAFGGGWSVKPLSMYHALNALPDRLRHNVLELGSGAGTQALKAMLPEATIVSYENDRQYVQPGVLTVFWDRFPDWVIPPPFGGRAYDLVIVDGPPGMDRAKWYELLIPVVQVGTILVVDDLGHLPAFEVTLNEYFEYETVAEYRPQVRRGETWRVCRVIATRNSRTRGPATRD